jgi:hypothetical protein
VHTVYHYLAVILRSFAAEYIIAVYLVSLGIDSYFALCFSVGRALLILLLAEELIDLYGNRLGLFVELIPVRQLGVLLVDSLVYLFFASSIASERASVYSSDS